MHDCDFGTQNHVLTSWKEIASYLGKGVRTVQRWEKDFGLPVRRPTGSDKTAILARTRDLDAWIAMRCSTRSSPAGFPDLDQRILAVRSSLAAGITTALMLREANAALVSEIRDVLTGLQSEIAHMRAARQRFPARLQSRIQSEPIAPPEHDLTAVGAA